ncbi:MAG: PAS domain S-box protein [Cyanobacteria bacterium J06592_8]
MILIANNHYFFALEDFNDSTIFSSQLNLISEALIAISFYALPILLLNWKRQKRYLPYQQIITLLALLEIALGTTHVLSFAIELYPSNSVLILLKTIITLFSCWILLKIISRIFQALSQLKFAQIQSYNSNLSEEFTTYNQELKKQVQERINKIDQVTHSLESQLKKYSLSEQQLNLTQERLHFLLSFSPVAIYTAKVEADYQITYVSPTIQSITGYQPYQFIEKPQFWVKQVHPEDFDQMLTQVSEISENQTKILEYRFLHQDGTYRWLRNELKLIDDQTPSSPEFIGYITDITERKQIEEALRESEERFRLMANSAPVLIWMANSEGICNFFNQAWLDFTGRTLQQEYDTGWQVSVHPEDLQNLLNICPSNTGKIEPFVIEFRLRRWDGEYRWLFEKAVPQMTSEGKLLGYIGSCIDITERKQAEDLLFSLNRELLQSNKELEQFAHLASHDLQEPLRIVKIFTQLLAHKYESNLEPDTQTYIDNILDASTRMQQLISDLLAYSQVGNRQSPVNFQQIDCNQVLQEVLQNLRITIAERSAIINYQQLPTIIGDQKQLAILFQNLISNAIKYCVPDVIPEIKIAVKSGFDRQSQTPQWCFSISDNGIGIKPEYFERIFKIFQRLHGNQEYPGTGIGLAICQKIVEGHGGKIWVESEVDKGSTFYFTLPMFGK